MRKGFPVLEKSWNFVILFKILVNAQNLGKTQMFQSYTTLFEFIAMHIRADEITWHVLHVLKWTRGGIVLFRSCGEGTFLADSNSRGLCEALKSFKKFLKFCRNSWKIHEFFQLRKMGNLFVLD